ncbi:MAG: hypothetical protein E6K55_02365 [Gemmatimonadetes bacterium]|nr:MAG: hypothetical protein E6K55_02365 [Gemmatimonadota bacterium]
MRRKPVVAVANGSFQNTQSPSCCVTASGLERSRKTTCKRGGCFLSYVRENGTREPSVRTASYVVGIVAPGQART